MPEIVRCSPIQLFRVTTPCGLSVKRILLPGNHHKSERWTDLDLLALIAILLLAHVEPSVTKAPWTRRGFAR
jgi:hypothetical protein